MVQYTEKRTHLRVPLTYVTVDVFSKDNKRASQETCSIFDISVSGMKFVTHLHYEINLPLKVTFILPNSTIPIHSNATVVYQQPKNSLFHTGVQFADLGLIEFALLKKYVESFTKKN